MKNIIFMTIFVVMGIYSSESVSGKILDVKESIRHAIMPK